jgi:inner membrane protein
LDNLTHSLAGALLGQMGLKRLSGRAMVTLVIAANLPDVDAFASVLGTESLAIRRGITHGPLAMLLLPPLLTALMLLWNRWRPAAQPVRPAALLLLAYIGTLSHPALDWLNSYGVRLLEPFSSRWYAGDTLFIIDLWIWLALIASVWISLRRERSGGDWRRPALAGFAAICVYILANGLITGRAEAQSRDLLEARGAAPELVVANPVPVTFWKRKMLWRNAAIHGGGAFDLFGGTSLAPTAAPNLLDHPALAAQRGRADVAAFLFWSRMPIVKQEDAGAVLTDQRFADSPVRTSFVIPLEPTAR